MDTSTILSEEVAGQFIRQINLSSFIAKFSNVRVDEEILKEKEFDKFIGSIAIRLFNNQKDSNCLSFIDLIKGFKFFFFYFFFYFMFFFFFFIKILFFQV